MKAVPNATYACSRPTRLKSGDYRLVVEQLLEMPPVWELKAWNEVVGYTPMLSVACSARRAIEGQVEIAHVERLNRVQVRVRYAVVGRMVSRVRKGAAKSTATNQS